MKLKPENLLVGLSNSMNAVMAEANIYTAWR